jgi:hypothetical protein
MISCGPSLNKRVTLWRNDKIPYGTYYAYNNLQYIFKNAEITTNNSSPITFFEENDSAGAYIIIGNKVKPDQKELRAILGYASTGNQVFISAFEIGQNLLDSFRLEVGDSKKNDSLSVSILHPGGNDSSSFSYPGFAIDSYFTKIDTSITNVLGRNAEGAPDFVKFTYEGGGSVSLQLAPTALTNFFLLHKNNKSYYDLAMSSIPASSRSIRWDDYYRHHTYGKDDSERSGFNKLAAFLNHPVLRWAFWLTILLFAIIYLFESKRKQRPVEVINPLRNSSLDFVQTIGRMYYQRRDNKNLAAKMAAHFIGHVRNKYNLSLSPSDESFVQKLSFKTGYPLEQIQEITSFVQSLETVNRVSDEELVSFGKKMDEFYKYT